MSQVEKFLNFISISDIHNGHNRVGSHIIYENMKIHLFPLLNEDMDILFISGDFFDTLLDLNSEAAFWSGRIIQELLEICYKNKVLIRVLRGTYSHDRNQCQMFLTNSKLMIGPDELVRVFDSISVETIKASNTQVLYVPDDLPYDDATPIIKDVIAKHQLSSVDIACVHSYFEHLIPQGMPFKPHNTYSADVFGSFVKGVILNGHVHKSCVYKKVVTNGSFERLNHGEEHPKGFFKLSYNKTDGHCEHEFIENTHATTFRTINLTKYGSEKEGFDFFMTWLDEIMRNDASTHDNVFIRIVSDDNVLKQSATAYGRSKYPNIRFTSAKATKVDKTNEADIVVSTYDLPEITPEFAPEMISEFMKKTGLGDLSPEQITKYVAPII